jgi:hypothetical protein
MPPGKTGPKAQQNGQKNKNINPLNAELNPIGHLLALVGARILFTLAG